MLFVIVHLPPDVVLHTIQTTVELAVNLFYYERKCFSTPIDSTFVFMPPRLTYIIPLMAVTGMRRAESGRQPAAAKSPLYLFVIFQ